MKRKVTAAAAVVAAAAIALVLTSAPAVATSTTHFSFTVPVSIDTQVSQSSYCDNTGPHITFSSTLVVGDHWVQLDLRNNTQGTHEVDAYAQVALSLSQTGTGGNPSIAKQPPLGGVGGDPFIYFRQDLSGRMFYLGRCVQDFSHGYDNPNSHFTAGGSSSAFTDLAVSAASCTNRGSNLDLNGTSGRNAVTGHLVLTNSYWGLNPQHINSNDVQANLGLDLVGSGLISKKGSVNGPGGNPLVYAATGLYPPWAYDDPSSAPGTFLGRCKQL